jgi:hypothetical protein
LRLKGWGSPNSNEGTYTVVLYIYKYFVVYKIRCSLTRVPHPQGTVLRPPSSPPLGLGVQGPPHSTGMKKRVYGRLIGEEWGVSAVTVTSCHKYITYYIRASLPVRIILASIKPRQTIQQ